MPDVDPEPTDEQVESRAGSLAAEPGNGRRDDPGVIRRTSDEGVLAEE